AVGLADGETRRVAFIRCSQYGAAQMGDAAHAFAVQRDKAALREFLGHHDAVIALTNTAHLPAAIDGAKHHRPDNGIQSWRIAAAGANRKLIDEYFAGLLLNVEQGLFGLDGVNLGRVHIWTVLL